MRKAAAAADFASLGRGQNINKTGREREKRDAKPAGSRAPVRREKEPQIET